MRNRILLSWVKMELNGAGRGGGGGEGGMDR